VCAVRFPRLPFTPNAAAALQAGAYRQTSSCAQAARDMLSRILLPGAPQEVRQCAALSTRESERGSVSGGGRCVADAYAREVRDRRAVPSDDDGEAGCPKRYGGVPAQNVEGRKASTGRAQHVYATRAMRDAVRTCPRCHSQCHGRPSGMSFMSGESAGRKEREQDNTRYSYDYMTIR